MDTHFLFGTAGSLSLPRLDLWRYGDQPGWHAPLCHERIEVAQADPYAEQLRHFVRVLRGEELPVSSGADATRTLAATLAVHEAARTLGVVRLG